MKLHICVCLFTGSVGGSHTWPPSRSAFNPASAFGIPPTTAFRPSNYQRSIDKPGRGLFRG